MNDRVKTQIILSLTILILISTSSYDIHHKQSSISTDSLQSSSTNNFSEDFESTTYMDEPETTVHGWGLSNITLPDKNITLSRTDQIANDLFILGDIAYMGGFYILCSYNISDPTSPTLLYYNSSIIIDIKSIYVDGGYLFAAVHRSGVVVFDVSDPTNIKYVTSLWDWDVDGGSLDLDPMPRHVWAIPSGSGTSWHVYLWDNNHGFVSLLFTEPDLIVQTGGYDPAPNNGIVNTMNGDLFIQDDIAYGTCGGVIIMINISDRANPVFISEYHPGSGGSFDRMFLLEDLIYYEHYYNPEGSYFKIVNVSDPYSPTPVYSSGYLSHSMSSISVSNGFAYLGYSLEVDFDRYAGYFSVYNVSDPSNANLIYTYASPFDYFLSSYWYGVYQIVAWGNYGYMFDREFFIIDISLIDQFESDATAQSKVIYSGVTKSIDRAYLSANSDLPLYTDVLYYLSADDGTHWEYVGLDTWHSFFNIGSKLRWKAILSTSDPYVSPSVFSINITYRTILNPVNLTTPFNQSLILDRTPYFEWSTITGAVSYILQIDNSSSFSSPTLLNFTSPNNYYTLTNELQDNNWYWRVGAIDNEGDKGMFSSTFFFTLDGLPGAPLLLSPQLDDYINDPKPNLSWNNVLDAYNYTIELDTIDSFSSLELIKIEGVTSTEYTLSTPLNENKWYWRVCAFDTSNNQGSFSESYHITIDVTIPTINNPIDQEIDIGTSGVQIQWNPSDANPASYIITKNGEEIYNQPWNGTSIVLNIDSSEHGTSLYNCTVFDKAGNLVSDLVTVVIKQANNAIPLGNYYLAFLVIGIFSLLMVQMRRRQSSSK